MLTARLIGMTFIGCPLLGVALGIVGVCSKTRKRVMAVIGLILNSLIFILLVGGSLLLYFMIQ